MKNQILLIALGASLGFIQSAQAETTIGRWCDRMIPNMPQYNTVMEIAITGAGNVELRSNSADGSSSAVALDEQGGGIYQQVDSHTGDQYRIIPSDGNLQLLDDDGIIRVARRLENAPQPDEC